MVVGGKEKKHVAVACFVANLYSSILVEIFVDYRGHGTGRSGLSSPSVLNVQELHTSAL